MIEMILYGIYSFAYPDRPDEKMPEKNIFRTVQQNHNNKQNIKLIDKHEAEKYFRNIVINIKMNFELSNNDNQDYYITLLDKSNLTKCTK